MGIILYKERGQPAIDALIEKLQEVGALKIADEECTLDIKMLSESNIENITLTESPYQKEFTFTKKVKRDRDMMLVKTA